MFELKLEKNWFDALYQRSSVRSYTGAPYTAVFAMSDIMAVGALRAIRDRGLRVPEDISVMGYDGIDLGRYLDPQLTTIRQYRDTIARRSLEILLDGMEGKPAVHEVVPFSLIPGESVRKI